MALLPSMRKAAATEAAIEAAASFLIVDFMALLLLKVEKFHRWKKGFPEEINLLTLIPALRNRRRRS